jgi:hypothetical protein
MVSVPTSKRPMEFGSMLYLERRFEVAVKAKE